MHMVHHTLWDLPFILILASGPDRLRKVPPGTWFIFTFDLELQFLKSCPLAHPSPSPSFTRKRHHTHTRALQILSPPQINVQCTSTNPLLLCPSQHEKYGPHQLCTCIYKREILELHFLINKEESFNFFFLILISIAIFVDAATGNVWEIWGKLVNDWDNARKKTSLIKVYARADTDSNQRFNYPTWSSLRLE